MTSDELEALIAKFTLEYLHRWTNNFEPAALAQFRELLQKAASTSVMVDILRTAQSRVAN